jgi:hypothetical protein
MQEFPFGRDWFAAFEEARRHPLIGGRAIKARIYRTNDALVSYIKQGLKELRANLGVRLGENNA